MPNRIIIIYGIIQAIRKHIAALQALSGADEDIRADEPSEFRAVITCVQIVQSRFVIVVVPTVAEGILCAHGVAAGVGHRAVAPGVVAVPRPDMPRGPAWSVL